MKASTKIFFGLATLCFSYGAYANCPSSVTQIYIDSIQTNVNNNSVYIHFQGEKADSLIKLSYGNDTDWGKILYVLAETAKDEAFPVDINCDSSTNTISKIILRTDA